VKVVASYPHDPQAYTQGLVLDDGGELLESTGRYGMSDLRRVEVTSGRVIRRTPLPKSWFGEGLALLPAGAVGEDGRGDAARLVQLTWREGVAALWDAVSFRRLGELSFSGEGWGLCWDDAGRRLVMSDGSDWLTFRDPSTFAPLDGVAVTLNGRPVRSLNELECVGGMVWANLYGSDDLVEIDPADGRVTAVVDASGLLNGEERRGVDVLNGIAFDAGDGTFLLTGKLWPKLFRVQMVAASTP
jgi:glutaminyl-peptide cyclotransferase